MNEVRQMKMNMMRAGYTITESPRENIDGIYIEVKCSKFSLDGLIFSNLSHILMIDYQDDHKYANILNEIATRIDKVLVKRSETDVNKCKHKNVIGKAIGDGYACENCTKEFDEIPVNLNRLVDHINRVNTLN